MRLFIAIELSKAVKEAIGAFQEELVRLAPRGVAWVKVENIHCTVKFLGEVEPDRLEPLKQALAALGAIAPPLLPVFGTGVFPRWTDPRVVWVGIDPLPPALKSLFNRVESVLAPLGFPREERPFQAHLTLGRVKDPRSATPRLLDALRAAKNRSFGAWTANEVTLFQSRLLPQGAAYTALQRLPLEGDQP